MQQVRKIYTERPAYFQLAPEQEASKKRAVSKTSVQTAQPQRHELEYVEDKETRKYKHQGQ